MISCPGSKSFKQPKPEIVKCAFCANEVEIWTDEIQAVCPGCKKPVIPKSTGAICLEWCRYAKDCVGGEAYSNYTKNKEVILKQKLIAALEEYFGSDIKRINHAKQVLDYAEALLRREGGDWHIVIPASVLHDIGIKAAEEKYGCSRGKYQEKEGPAIAEKILLKIGFKKADTEEICRIIAHHHSPGKIDTQNFKILYDADWLVNFKDEIDLIDRDKAARFINKVFFTKTAKEIAKKIYL